MRQKGQITWGPIGRVSKGLFSGISVPIPHPHAAFHPWWRLKSLPSTHRAFLPCLSSGGRCLLLFPVSFHLFWSPPHLLRPAVATGGKGGGERSSSLQHECPEHSCLWPAPVTSLWIPQPESILEAQPPAPGEAEGAEVHPRSPFTLCLCSTWFPR